MRSFIEQFENILALSHLAIDLREGFKITESRKWNITKGIMEIGVQLGHLSTAILKNNSNLSLNIIEEEKRKINNIEDEVADCLFQFLYILKKFDLSFFQKEVKNFEQQYQLLSTLTAQELIAFLNIIFGQILESLMKVNKHRFPRIRTKPEHVFFVDKLVQFLALIFHIANVYNINLSQSFIKMKREAEIFLSSYKTYYKAQKENKKELTLLRKILNK